MIVKNLIRDCTAAVVGYNIRTVREEGGHVIFSNLVSESASGIGREFGTISANRPRVKKPSVHMVMALHQDDEKKVDDWIFAELAHEYRRRLGLDLAQAIIWRHTDKPHPHIHCLINRVTLDDRVVSMWNLRRKVEAFTSEMCRRHGFRALDAAEFDDVHPELFNSQNKRLAL